MSNREVYQVCNPTFISSYGCRGSRYTVVASSANEAKDLVWNHGAIHRPTRRKSQLISIVATSEYVPGKLGRLDPNKHKSGVYIYETSNGNTGRFRWRLWKSKRDVEVEKVLKSADRRVKRLRSKGWKQSDFAKALGKFFETTNAETSAS